jgi:hypothetical protein
VGNATLVVANVLTCNKHSQIYIASPQQQLPALLRLPRLVKLKLESVMAGTAHTFTALVSLTQLAELSMSHTYGLCAEDLRMLTVLTGLTKLQWWLPEEDNRGSSIEVALVNTVS